MEPDLDKPFIYPRRKVILMADTSRQWTRDLMTGIAEYIRLRRSWTIYQTPPFFRMPSSQMETTPLLINTTADGIIVGGNVNPDIISELKIPLVLIESRTPTKKYPRLYSDSSTLGIMAANFFLGLSFEHFAFCGFDDVDWSCDRKTAFCKTIKNSGYPVQCFGSPVSLSLKRWQKEKQMLADWLSSLPKPIGVFACNDEYGQFVLQICNDAHIKVPDEVAVLGSDNDKMICELTDPPLSSIAYNTQKGGYEAAALLDKLMNAEKVRQKAILIEPTHIVTRKSTEILAVKDPKICSAIRFIHENIDQLIQVDDVARKVALPRRTLTERFRRILNRSVYDEICRVKADRIAQLLLETDFPIHQIAYKMGFSTPEHISRFFRNEKGVSPAEFRNQRQLKLIT